MAEWSPFRAYVPVARRGFFSWQDWLCVAALLGASAWLWHSASRLPQYEWQWPLLGEFLIAHGRNGGLEAGLLLRGLFTTLRVGIWTFLFSLLLGGLLGILASRKSFRLPCAAVINLIRNTPPLVILFVVYFFAGNLLPVAELEALVRKLPPFGKTLVAWVFAPAGQMDRMLAAILALGAYQAAYVAEITRGAIASVPRGQWDASRSLGFGRWQTIWLVILPQAARSMLPPLTGQCISTFKDSALASLISLPDLTFQSLEIMAVSSMTFEIWISAAVIYLLVGAVCACLGNLLENRYSRHIR
ncbi:MAG: amino acid ABC transporter permease [Desulfovibrio sp.]|nr:amino acid ABC transporter permease [Desulfovibrio sp.]